MIISEKMQNPRKPAGLLCLFFFLFLALLSNRANALAASDSPRTIPGPDDLQAIRSGIEHPRADEYFPEYRYAVVRAPGGHSVNGYGSADHMGRVFTVPDGAEVIILAEREGYCCTIVTEEQKGRWINSEYLEACWAVPGGNLYFSLETGSITHCDIGVTEAPVPARLSGADVVAVSPGAFSGCTELKAVTLPDSVVSVGREAFSGCTSLTDVRLPETLSAVSDRLFSGCSALTEVLLPDAITSIGNEAFYQCTSLISVSIPERVEELGYRAFSDCTSLSTAVLPASVSSVGGEAFADCTGLKEAILPQALTVIPDRMFSGCTKLTELHLPETLTVIGYRAFCSCEALKSIVLPDTLVSIDIEAFAFCGALFSIALPESLVDVVANPFVSCENLTQISVSPGNPVLEALDGVLFDRQNHRLICYPCAFRAQSYAIPSGTRIIGEEAFASCSALKNVIFPESVVTIEPLAFYRCHSLADVTLPDSVTEVGKDAFRECENLSFYDFYLFS